MGNSSFFATALDRAFSSAVSSYEKQLVTDVQSLMDETGKSQIDSLFQRDTKVYLNYLRDYSFVDSIVESLCSVVKDSLLKADLKVSVDKSDTNEEKKKIEVFINRNIERSKVKQYLEEKLPEFIYYGNYFTILKKEIDKKGRDIFKLKEIKDPHFVKHVYREGELVGYLSSKKFIPVKNACSYNFRFKTVKKISAKDAKDHNIDPTKNNKHKDKSLFEKTPKPIKQQTIQTTSFVVDDQIVYFEYKEGRGIFHNQIDKVYDLFLKEFILFFLSLKDSIRQDLLTVTVNADNKRDIDLSSVVSNIESALNVSDSLLSQQEPQQLLNQVIFRLFNSTRVLPAVTNYSDVGKVDLNDLNEQRQRLEEEIQKKRTENLSQLSIPQEIFEGTGNRWEILSRNDRFMQLINSILTSLSTFVKDYALSVALQNGDELDPSDISVEIRNSSSMKTESLKAKTASIAERMMEINQVLEAARMLKMSGFFEDEKLVEFIKTQLKEVDNPIEATFATDEEIIKRLNAPPPEEEGGY